MSIMVQSVGIAMQRVMRDSLALAGFASSQVYTFGEQPCKVERLVLVDGLTEHGSYMSPLVMECLQDLTGHVAPSRSGKLFVVRRDARTRRFAKEADLVAAALRSGFTVVDPSEYGFLDQVALFKGARTVVGAMGAGMANTAFLEPGSEVRLMAPDCMPDTFFWFIAGLRTLRYLEVRCSQGEGRQELPWDRDVEVDAGDVDLICSGEALNHAEPNQAVMEVAGVLDGLFERTYYLSQVGGIESMSWDDALLHYLEHGWLRGLNPSSRFSSDAYLLAHPDVARSGINPLVHYIQYGRCENRGIMAVT